MRYSCVKWVSNCAAAAPPQLANVADAEMSRRKICFSHLVVALRLIQVVSIFSDDWMDELGKKSD